MAQSKPCTFMSPAILLVGLVLTTGCKKEVPEDILPIPDPPTAAAVFNLGDTTDMVVTYFGTTYGPATVNQWYSFPLQVQALGSTLYLNLSTSYALTGSGGSRIELVRSPGSGVLFNGVSMVDTTYRRVDSVLTYTGFGSHPYTLTINTTTGCAVEGSLHGITEQFTPFLFQPEALVDTLLYADVDMGLKYWNGSSSSSPISTVVNDSTIRYTNDVDHGTCFSLPPTGDVFHLAIARMEEGTLKQGWLTMERPPNSGLITVHYAAFEP